MGGQDRLNEPSMCRGDIGWPPLAGGGERHAADNREEPLPSRPGAWLAGLSTGDRVLGPGSDPARQWCSSVLLNFCGFTCRGHLQRPNCKCQGQGGVRHEALASRSRGQRGAGSGSSPARLGPHCSPKISSLSGLFCLCLVTPPSHKTKRQTSTEATRSLHWRCTN